MKSLFATHPKWLLTLFLLAPTAIAAQGEGDNYASYLNQPMPERWVNGGSSDFNNSEAQPQDKWWKSLDDSTLDWLIEQGLANNYDLRAASRRMEVARLTLKSAEAGYYPSVGVSAGWQKSRNSGLMYGREGKASDMSYFNLGANLSWEVDLFGRVNARASQQKALYQASKADYDGAMLSLAAQIASQYIQLRGWQAELAVANEHIGRQHKVVKLTEARKEVGLASGLDVAQAMIVYNSTQASVPMLENSILTGINALAILTGAYPEEIRDKLITPRPLPDYRQIVGAGIPMDLLRRRPDIAQAERQLAAQAEAIGIAKKDYLPTLTINGSLGTAAHDARDLFKGESYTYSIAPTLSWTMFDGFQRKYNVAIAQEQMQAQIDSYNLTVMTAVQEVDNAMATYLAQTRHIDNIDAVIDQCNKALDLSIDLYKRGLNPFSDVVTAQLNLLQYQDQEVVAKGQALIALVNLYKALGGTPR